MNKDLLNTTACERMRNQALAGSQMQSPEDLLAWMGPMQAQDSSMSLWAIGCRISGVAESEVQKSLNRGSIVRTHIMRPTWHLVRADDLRWINRIASKRITQSMAGGLKRLEISAAVKKKAFGVIENSLRNEDYIEREALLENWEAAGIRTGENRAAYLLMLAELEELITSGPFQKGKSTYALLSQRLSAHTQNPLPSLEEAQARLARIYLQSHGPASHRDFAWWAGITLNDARRAFAACDNAIVFASLENKDGGKDDYFVLDKSGHASAAGADHVKKIASKGAQRKNSRTSRKLPSNGFQLLPAFDEFLIAYANRRPSLAADQESQVLTKNGIFRPALMSDGAIRGIWKRTINKDRVIVEVEPFRKLASDEWEAIAMACKSLGDFLGKEAQLDV